MSKISGQCPKLLLIKLVSRDIDRKLVYSIILTHMVYWWLQMAYPKENGLVEVPSIGPRLG
jgi:hypothetical protein